MMDGCVCVSTGKQGRAREYRRASGTHGTLMPQSYSRTLGKRDHGYGFSRDRRLRQSGDFQEIFQQGRSYPGRFIVLWVGPRARGKGRLGVITSRRALRRSVDRSRARRLMREAYRLNRRRLAGDCDILLVARRRITEAGRPEVEEELMRLVRRAAIAADEQTTSEEM